MSVVPQPALQPTKHLYFVNKWVDFTIIGGGSILLYALFWFIERTHLHADGTYGEGKARLVYAAAAWAGVAVWVVNWPHFSATSYRLYHTRKNIAQYPVTALVVPILILMAMVGSFASPLLIAPLFVKLYLAWSPYHFSGQTSGITLIYARRAGFSVGKMERFCLSGFIFGTFACTTARAEVGINTSKEGDVVFPTLGLPRWVGDYAEIGMYVFGAAFLVFVVAWCIRSRRILPPIVLLPAITQWVWFLPMSHVESIYYFVPFFHSLQYLLIAWSLQLKEKMDENGIAPSIKYVSVESVRWLSINVAGGIFLFQLFPHLTTLAGYPYGFAEPVVLAAVQMHHFFVDGVIWKLKNPKVSSPLLANIDDMMRPPAQPVREVA